jgi:UPF0716 protein FxsA
MGVTILLLLIGVPLLEIAVFVEVGAQIGVAATVLLVLLSAIVGISLLRAQGFATLRRAQGSLDRGEMPLADALDGLGLLLAGGLLIFPGFVTDVAGLLLFIPAVRKTAGRWIGRNMAAKGTVRFTVWPPSARRPPPSRGPVIDGEYEDVSDETRPSPRLPPRGPDVP